MNAAALTWNSLNICGIGLRSTLANTFSRPLRGKSATTPKHISSTDSTDGALNDNADAVDMKTLSRVTLSHQQKYGDGFTGDDFYFSSLLPRQISSLATGAHYDHLSEQHLLGNEPPFTLSFILLIDKYFRRCHLWNI